MSLNFSNRRREGGLTVDTGGRIRHISRPLAILAPNFQEHYLG